MALSPPRPAVLLTVLALCGTLLTACGTDTGGQPPVVVSGSASLNPLTAALARQSGTRIELAPGGTRDGFDVFCRGESALNNASVPIPGPDVEVDYQRMCTENGVEYIELPVALGAVTLVVNDDLDFVTDLSHAQLARLWSADHPARLWSELNPAWPVEEIRLYGRPEGSGTRDFFRRQVLGEEGRLREDHPVTDEIDQLSAWIAEDPQGIGYMGVGNYLATPGTIRRELRNVAVEGILPTRQNTQAGRYPLARPLFIYVAVDALEEPAVREFTDHYVRHAEAMAPRVHFFPLPHEGHELAAQRWAGRETGTLFGAPGQGSGTDVVAVLRGG